MSYLITDAIDQMMDKDPEDLSIPVNDVLSGTQARKLYRSRRDDILCLVAKLLSSFR